MKLNTRKIFKETTSLAVVAMLLAALVIINLLTGALADRFHLSYDLTDSKKNSISKENLEYIKAVDRPVDIYFLTGSDTDYTDNGYMAYYAEQSYYKDATGDYYKQTCKLINQYPDYNDNIKLHYVDPQGTEFSQIATNYQDDFSYGDILVTAMVDTSVGGAVKNHKVLKYNDIYNIEDTSGYAGYGMDYYYVTGSNLENALTGAIYTVISGEPHKVGLITSHSKEEDLTDCRNLLEKNNYDITDITEKVITGIPSELDSVVIFAPESDFLGSELDVISEYLDNGGNKGKGLIYFADTANQNLPNLKEFLTEWGISFEEGIVFETSDSYRVFDGDYSTFRTLGQTTESGTADNVSFCITGYNVPMYENNKAYNGRTTESLVKTSQSVVVAPIGTPTEWVPTNDYEMRQLSGAILSSEEVYINGDYSTSYVAAFSSYDYISSDWTKYTDLGNKTISLNVFAKVTGNTGATLDIEAKTITQTNFTDKVSVVTTKVMAVIMVGVIPIGLLVLAATVFIRRKNK